jgi:hypothetical protein
MDVWIGVAVGVVAALAQTARASSPNYTQPGMAMQGYIL